MHIWVKTCKSPEKTSHLIYMDEIKLFAKNEKELKTLIYSQDIGMEFGIEKYALLMKSGKWHMTEGIELPNQEKIRTLGEKETYKYLGILEVGTIKQVEMKENFLKRVPQEDGKATRNQTIEQVSYKRGKYLVFPKIHGTIFEVDQRRT